MSILLPEKIMQKKVGRDLFDGPCSRYLSYYDIETDDDGWVYARDYLPADFDLVDCVIRGLRKTLVGWCSGTQWDGYRFEPHYIVKYWKLKKKESNERL